MFTPALIHCPGQDSFLMTYIQCLGYCVECHNVIFLCQSTVGFKQSEVMPFATAVTLFSCTALVSTQPELDNISIYEIVISGSVNSDAGPMDMEDVQIQVWKDSRLVWCYSRILT